MLRAALALAGLAGGCGFSARATPGGSDAAIDVDGAAIDGAIDVPVMPGARRRKLITFDHNKVTGTQTDFPAWIDLTDDDIAARIQADGHDLYFTAFDGTTALDHELQLVDKPGHHVTAWVRIPTLNGTAETKIYINYGDPAAAPAANPAGVFKADYTAVWHLDDALPAATIVDAVGQRNGTPQLTAATTSKPARLGNGLAFSATATTDQITFTNPFTGNGPHTVSVWVDQAAGISHTASIIAMGTPTLNNARWLHGHYAPPAAVASSLAAGFYTNDFNPNPVENLDGAGLTYVVWVFEGANKKNHLYRNGVEIAAGVFMVGNGVATTGTAGSIGNAPAQYGLNNVYNGTLDELRLSTVARSAGWIATEWENQRAASTFYSVGPELVP